MSDANPFETPVEATDNKSYAPPVPSGPPPIPTSLMAISIIGIILGVLGLFGVCIGGLGLAATGALVDMMPSEEMKVAMKDVMDLQFVPSIIQLGLSLILSPLLIAASIGCLTRKSWSQGLMKLSLIGSIFSSIVGLGLTAWMLLLHWDVLVAPTVAQGGSEVSAVAGQVAGVAVSVLMLAFLVWALIAMGGKSITAFYDRIGGVGR